jgi:putative AlgH/UPF0301 family transcriptional regulator
LLHPFGDLSKTEKTSLHHSFTAVSGGATAGKRIIESAPNDARYYVGNVIWRPGELAMELDKGMWTVLPVSNEIVFRKNISGLWKSLNEDSKLLYTGMPVPATVLALLLR